MILVLAATTALATWVLTGLVLRWTPIRGWLDVPNDRSSHSAPTPRGGGIAIVIVTLAGMAFSVGAGWISTSQVLAFGGGGCLVAAAGWADDRASLSAWTRIAIHFAAAIWALYWIGGLHGISLLGLEIQSAALANFLAAIGIVWATNLYNFMDGIDGIAAVEGISVGVMAALLFTIIGAPDLGAISTLLAASSFGFLVWNWSPARIFMGDVGSGFLGFQFGCVAVAGEHARPGSLIWILALAGVFVFDATATILRRALHREPIHAAHRSHAYQRITRAGLSHGLTSGVVAGVNVFLATLTLLALVYPSWGVAMFSLCVLVLAVLYVAVERRNPMYSRREIGPS